MHDKHMQTHFLLFSIFPYFEPTVLEGSYAIFHRALCSNPSSQVVAMTGDCMGDLESPPDCAADITDFIDSWHGLLGETLVSME